MKRVQAVVRTYKYLDNDGPYRYGDLDSCLQQGWFVVSSHAFDDGWIEYIVEKEISDND